MDMNNAKRAEGAKEMEMVSAGDGARMVKKQATKSIRMTPRLW